MVAPPDGLTGRFRLVLSGLIVTVAAQPFSAGVATASAALGAGAISFPQAAEQVIGMDVGATLTALPAPVGGWIMAPLTGVARVVYN